MKRRRRLLLMGGAGSAPTTLTLDLIATQPAGAYGFRKLRSAYAGSCLRVRRSSDSTEQDIGFSGNNLDTAALSAFVGGGSGFIRTLYDQSANANHLNQTVAGQQPLYTSSAMAVDGVDDVMIFTAPISHTSGYCIFSNLTITDTAGTKGIVSSDAVAGGLYLRVGTTEAFTIVRTAQAVLLTGSAGKTAKAIVRTRTFSTGNSINIDGVSDGTNATNNALTQPVLVAFAGANNGSESMAGSAQELIIYQADLSTADSNLIGANMAAFAGTSWTPIP